MNPMKEFKSPTKEYTIQGKKVVFQILSFSDITEINKKIKNILKVEDDKKLREHPRYEEEYQSLVLAYCIKSIDGYALKDFDDVAKLTKTGMEEVLAKKQEIQSWEPIMVTVLFSYYIKFVSEKNKAYDKDFDFLKG